MAFLRKLAPAVWLAGFVAVGGMAACFSSSPEDEAIDERVGATTGVFTGSSGSWVDNGTGGAGGTSDISENFGSGGNQTPTPFAQQCGEGCLPATGTASECIADDDEDEGILDCQLLANPSGKVQGECVSVGEAMQGEPCLDSSDCGPGLGCVEPGVCRAYCCDSPEACPEASFCALTEMAMNPMPQGMSDRLPQIPVCVPASNCQLFDDPSCREQGEMCTIVRADATTSCVPPGSGEWAEPCPCAEGYVCSTANDQCRKLCRLDMPEECPDDHTCQGGADTYPDNIGVCVHN